VREGRETKSDFNCYLRLGLEGIMLSTINMGIYLILLLLWDFLSALGSALVFGLDIDRINISMEFHSAGVLGWMVGICGVRKGLYARIEISRHCMSSC
jgi:hypothetical protein